MTKNKVKVENFTELTIWEKIKNLLSNLVNLFK